MNPRRRAELRDGMLRQSPDLRSHALNLEWLLLDAHERIDALERKLAELTGGGVRASAPSVIVVDGVEHYDAATWPEGRASFHRERDLYRLRFVKDRGRWVTPKAEADRLLAEDRTR